MLIRDYIKTDDIVINDFNDKVNEMLVNMRLSYKAKDCIPKYWFETYKTSKSSQGAIDKMISSFKKRKGKKCCMFKYGKTSLQSILHTTKISPLADYTSDIFYEVIKQMASFLITEYGELYECQIKLGAYKCLLSLFRCWEYTRDDDIQFIFDIDDVNLTIERLLDTDTKSLIFSEDMQKHIVRREKNLSTEAIRQEKESVLHKPKTIEHLTSLWDDDTKQIDRVERVKDYWHCSRSTAVRYMQKFGLWKPVKINNNRDIGRGANELFDTNQNKDKISAIELEIKRLQQELKKLKNNNSTSASLF